MTFTDFLLIFSPPFNIENKTNKISAWKYFKKNWKIRKSVGAWTGIKPVGLRPVLVFESGRAVGLAAHNLS